ncbi:uncharacterized protein LOC134098255 [Sardina pilchardus]|uniref:uncharacterized protein LOC134098255 n=1 Tax=Sardina pilchardus TaxID=27697 RepID=UPI002E158E3E
MFCLASAFALRAVVVFLGLVALCLGHEDVKQSKTFLSAHDKSPVATMRENSADTETHFHNSKFRRGTKDSTHYSGLKEADRSSSKPRSQPAPEEPAVQCGDQIMRVIIKLQDVNNLQVFAANYYVPLSLSELPAFCNMYLRTTSNEAVLISRYDGCFISKQGSEYVLYLRWFGRAVRVSCPATESPPQVTCRQHTMEVAFSGHGLENALSVRVGGGWVPLLHAAVQCSFEVDVTPRQLSFTAPYSSCAVASEKSLSIIFRSSKFHNSPSTRSKFQNSLPTLSKFQDTLPTTSKFQNSLPTTSKFQNSPPTTSKFQNSPPTTSKFQNSPPTTSKFQNSPPTLSKFQNSPLTPNKFQNSPPTLSKFQNSPPTMTKFQNSPPTPSKFQNSPPTLSKFQNSPPILSKFQNSPPTTSK